MACRLYEAEHGSHTGALLWSIMLAVKFVQSANRKAGRMAMGAGIHRGIARQCGSQPFREAIVVDAVTEQPRLLEGHWPHRTLIVAFRSAKGKFNSSQSDGRRTPPRTATVSTIAGYPSGTHTAGPL